MTGIQKRIIIGAAFFLVTNGTLYAVYADHDRHKEKQWYQNIFDWDDDDDDNHHDHKKHRNNSKQHKKRYLTRVNNPTYKEECGACHFAYQPELLPSGSWEKILAGHENHFGEGIELDPESKKDNRGISQRECCGTFFCKKSRQDHENLGKANTTENYPDSIYSGKAP